MGLKSQLFRNNARLQACARENPAHVTRGAEGEHVAKIQHALFEIDGLRIEAAELISQRYGPSTAGAVLTYKQKRQVINRSYQNTADDIVGIMTIASLDQEMTLRESNPKSTGECRPGGGGSFRFPSINASISPVSALAGAAKGGAAAPGKGPNKQLGGVARIAVFFASNAKSEGFHLSEEIERARDCLFEHGISFAVTQLFTGGDTIKFTERVLVNPDAAGDNVNELRKRCEDLMPNQPGVLRAIVCRMGNFHGGQTIRNRRVGNLLFPPFILLNTETVNLSNSTLIHEMIHASKPGPVEHDPEPFSVFFGQITANRGDVEQTFLKPEHAATISAAFFTVGGTPPPKAK